LSPFSTYTFTVSVESGTFDGRMPNVSSLAALPQWKLDGSCGDASACQTYGGGGTLLVAARTYTLPTKGSWRVR